MRNEGCDLTDFSQQITRDARAAGAAEYREGFQTKPLRKVRYREESITDLMMPGESFEAAKVRFKKVSKRNINELLKRMPTSAKDLGVDGRWLNRLNEEGLGYVSKASKDNLIRLARHFGYPSHLDLWREELLEQLELPPSAEQVETWSLSPHWKQADKLIQLLDSGKFDDLGKYVDDLHDRWFSPGKSHFGLPNNGVVGQPELSESVEKVSMSDFVKKTKKKK